MVPVAPPLINTRIDHTQYVSTSVCVTLAAYGMKPSQARHHDYLMHFETSCITDVNEIIAQNEWG